VQTNEILNTFVYFVSFVVRKWFSGIVWGLSFEIGDFDMCLIFFLIAHLLLCDTIVVTKG
jgi:hypothetical protein